MKKGVYCNKDLCKKWNSVSKKIFGSFYLSDELVEKAEGVWIFTKNNEKILDVTGGIGVLNHGHNHPRILKARANYQNRKKYEIFKQKRLANPKKIGKLF